MFMFIHNRTKNVANVLTDQNSAQCCVGRAYYNDNKALQWLYFLLFLKVSSNIARELKVLLEFLA